MDPYANEWLDLLVRWLHVVAAIAWIGSSFYFIALDNHLRPPKDEADAERGVGGEAWEIHGGGFYQRAEVPARAADAARAAALVQVGGLHDLALRLRAADRAVLLQRQHVPDRQVGRRPAAVAGDRDQRRPPDRGLARLRRPLPADPERRRTGCRAARAGDARGLGRQPPVLRPRRVHPDRRDARHDDGRQRLLRDHPGPLGARSAPSRRAASRTPRRASAPSSARSTTTT